MVLRERLVVVDARIAGHMRILPSARVAMKELWGHSVKRVVLCRFALCVQGTNPTLPVSSKPSNDCIDILLLSRVEALPFRRT